MILALALLLPVALHASPVPAAEAPPLTSFGVEASPEMGRLRVRYVLPGSTAWGLGLRSDDLLLDLAGTEAAGAAAAARALSAWRPETRLWAIVRRGAEVLTLESDLPRLTLAAPRGPETLSDAERERAGRIAEDAAEARDAILRSLPTPRLQVPAGRKAWVRFPAGLPDTLATGDLVEARWTTGLAADPDLDYLAVLPNSQAWAQVAEAGWRRGVRTLRLRLFKTSVEGGHSYPLSARIVDAAGDRLLTRVSPGGTIVTGEVGGPAPDTAFQIELQEPLTLYESPSYFRAGVGLWLRERGAGRERSLEVAEVVPDRSAHAAGVRSGDVLLSVDGYSAATLDLGAALARLYGAPGTDVRVAFERAGARLPEIGTLTRGVMFRVEDEPAAGAARAVSLKRRRVSVPVPPPFRQ